MVTTTHMEELKISRPWGKFEVLVLNDVCTVKIISIKKGERTSLQYHKKRTEHWRLLSGECMFDNGDRQESLSKESVIEIGKSEWHRLVALEDSEVLEISLGVFDENDIVRIQDDYAR